MLKTNSKKAKENLKKYIMEYSEPSFIDAMEYAKETSKNFNYKIDSFSDRCKYLYERFTEEYCNQWNLKQHRYNYLSIFEDWTRGLPVGGLFCYWYNREAKDDLQVILEETEQEKSRYTEEQAEKLLTSLLYYTIYNNYLKAKKEVQNNDN